MCDKYLQSLSKYNSTAEIAGSGVGSAFTTEALLPSCKLHH